ncbi:flagellar export chaperone FliS [Paenibacillus xerothermodurans]|uniref:Flagellar secretion chaperone FliS n=1 Tax=Paenibacillus xerothermodurans TaxID=1977292 RepID=A0A2W1NUC5_PAEXE|nr:flagellar export chaperone FliS [Paenibacillus xerothermodurans]PZE19282.1 flagellar export chaperone FliS [Paenibacillus xerothermodurans]
MLQMQRNKYLETTVQTATPAQLLIILCDGAIRFCKQAIAAIEQRNYEDANKNLTKTQDIISEFAITLDRQASIAEPLLKLYEYFNFRLIEANIQKKTEPAEEVLGYLIQLKETWMEAAKAGNNANAQLG